MNGVQVRPDNWGERADRGNELKEQNPWSEEELEYWQKAASSQAVTTVDQYLQIDPHGGAISTTYCNYLFSTSTHPQVGVTEPWLL